MDKTPSFVSLSASYRELGCLVCAVRESPVTSSFESPVPPFFFSALRTPGGLIVFLVITEILGRNLWLYVPPLLSVLKSRKSSNKWWKVKIMVSLDSSIDITQCLLNIQLNMANGCKRMWVFWLTFIFSLVLAGSFALVKDWCCYFSAGFARPNDRW